MPLYGHFPLPQVEQNLDVLDDDGMKRRTFFVVADVCVYSLVALYI